MAVVLSNDRSRALCEDEIGKTSMDSEDKLKTRSEACVQRGVRWAASECTDALTFANMNPKQQQCAGAR